MFIVSMCIYSPNIDPTMSVIIRSCVLGFSAVASIKVFPNKCCRRESMVKFIENIDTD